MAISMDEDTAKLRERDVAGLREDFTALTDGTITGERAAYMAERMPEFARGNRISLHEMDPKGKLSDRDVERQLLKIREEAQYVAKLRERDVAGLREDFTALTDGTITGERAAFMAERMPVFARSNRINLHEIDPKHELSDREVERQLLKIREEAQRVNVARIQAADGSKFDALKGKSQIAFSQAGPRSATESSPTAAAPATARNNGQKAQPPGLGKG